MKKIVRSLLIREMLMGSLSEERLLSLNLRQSVIQSIKMESQRELSLLITTALISDLNKQNYKITKELSLLLLENNEMNKVLLNEDALSNSKSGNDILRNI